MYVTEFKVTGKGEFPVDMLRYDCCFPSDEESSLRIVVDRSLNDYYLERTISLKIYSNRKLDETITYRRWESFGWKVHSTERRKVG